MSVHLLPFVLVVVHYKLSLRRLHLIALEQETPASTCGMATTEELTERVTAISLSEQHPGQAIPVHTTGETVATAAAEVVSSLYVQS